MNNNQINGQKNNKEAYCPNPIFNNGTVSIGEFKTIEDAMNFPMQEIWCINRTQDNKFNSYVSQGCRLLIICDWGKSIQDSQKFVVALISKSGKITYWDLNDLPINTRQYENSIDNDVLTAIYAVADELYRNNNQLNCNLNMNKKLIRLTESDLHKIVKESVNKVITELDWKTYRSAAMKSAQRGDNWRVRHSGRPSDFLQASDREFEKQYFGNHLDKYGHRYLDDKYGGDDLDVYKTTEEPDEWKGLPTDNKFTDKIVRTWNRDLPNYHPMFNDDEIKHGYPHQSWERGSEVYKNGEGVDTNDDPLSEPINRANQEIADFRNGKYTYIKGKGWVKK